MEYPDLEMTKVAAAYAVESPDNVGDAIAHSSLVAGMLMGLANGKKEAGQLSPEDQRIIGLVASVCQKTAEMADQLNTKTASIDIADAVSLLENDFFISMMSDKVAYAKEGNLRLLDKHFDATDLEFCEKVAEKYAGLFEKQANDEMEEIQYGEEANDDADVENGMAESLEEKKKKKQRQALENNEGELEEGGDMDESNGGVVGEDALAEALRRVNSTTYSPMEEGMDAMDGEENEMAEVARLLEALNSGQLGGADGMSSSEGIGPMLASMGHAGRMMQ